MIRFFKYLKPIDWTLFCFMIVMLVGQIWCDVTLPTYTAKIVADMRVGASTAQLLDTGKYMVFFALGSIGATIVQAVLSAFISTRLGANIRKSVFDKAIALNETDDRFTPASLLTRTTNDVQNIVSAMVLGLRLGIGAPLMAIMAIVKIATVTWELTVTTAIFVIILVTGIMVIMFTVTPRFKIIQKLTDKLNGVSRENITGIRVIRAYNAESYEKNKFDEVNSQITKVNTFTGRVMAAMNPLITMINYGLTLAIYWVGCYIILKTEDAGFFAQMFSFSQLAGQVILAFMVLIMLFNMIPRAQVSAKRINELLDFTVSVSDCSEPRAFSEIGTVEFNNVSFGYSGEEKEVISQISFRVERGQTLAVIGSIGSGKSTVVKLISRLFDVTKGSVKVNGEDIREVALNDLRKAVGYVPQKSILFSGTIRENLALGLTDASDEELNKAAEVACASGFLSEKSGLDTEVSQGGKNFSGGQKQRLAIARAVAHKPQIYIFDDSFSALDYLTDATVRKNLKEYCPDATKIIVAQRVGTIMDADRILVLDGGKIVGSGTHSELMESCGIYKEIASSQLGTEVTA